MAPPGPEPSIACLGRPRPRSNKSRIAAAITSNMLKSSNVLLIPHAAAITERNVTQRYLALWTPRLLSVGLIRCKRGWSHRLTLLWTREERELAHLNLYRLGSGPINFLA